MNRAIVLALSLAPQVLLLAGMIAREEIRHATGTEVVLEVRPYDPVDMLSGRYLAVPLAIERLETSAITHPNPPLEHGRAVWVGLARGEPVWTPHALIGHAPDVERTQELVWLRGRMDEAWSGGGVIQVAYDLDRFYIPEQGADPSVGAGVGTAARRLALVVRVDAAGRGSIADLLVNGEPYAEWNRKED